MSILIIGAGMAGLASAVHTKEILPEEQIVVLEQPKQVANTLIAGQRLRKKRNAELFPNDGNQITEGFLKRIPKALNYWEDVIGSQENEEWFGPQLAGGKGIATIKAMKDKALSLGVEFAQGTVIQLLCGGNSAVDGAVVMNKDDKHILHADTYILANGGSIGELFQSTNIANSDNGHVLAYKAGIPLVGGTVNMFHPFGKPEGAGCYATDELEGVTVQLGNGSIDEETMDLLRQHNAHENFPSICARFVSSGEGKVTLQFPNGNRRSAQVALHHSLLGIDTTDGVRVKGKENLFAVGDVGSFGSATGYIQRPAGTGQLKCLVDGLQISEFIKENAQFQNVRSKIKTEVYNGDANVQVPKDNNNELRKINLAGLLGIEFANSTQESETALLVWQNRLLQHQETSVLAQLSMGIANAHLIRKEISEPITINREMSGMARAWRL